MLRKIIWTIVLIACVFMFLSIWDTQSHSMMVVKLLLSTSLGAVAITDILLIREVDADEE